MSPREGEPRTAAGRRLLEDVPLNGIAREADQLATYEWFAAAIVAIEAEAAASPTAGEPLDRLTYRQVVDALDAATYQSSDRENARGVHVGRLMHELNELLAARLAPSPETDKP